MNESEQDFSALIKRRMPEYAALARRYYDEMGGVKTMPREHPGGTKQLKAIAKRLRQAELDIKRLQECLPASMGGDLLSGSRNTAAEVGHLASVVEMTFKAGRPVNLLLIFSITIATAAALLYYEKAGVPPDWPVIGGPLRAVFNDVLQEEKYQDDGEWARKTFKRYKEMWASEQLVYAGMVSALRRKFLDKCKDEKVILPPGYFEKLRSSTTAKVVLLS